MSRLRPKFAIVISACLLGMNFVANIAFAAAPCPPSICCGNSMHNAGMLNFAFSVQKCCDDCSDLLCGLLNDPLQDVKPVPPSPEIGYSDSPHAVFLQPAGISSGHLLLSKLWQFLAFEVVSKPVPLYIEHLALII